MMTRKYPLFDFEYLVEMFGEKLGGAGIRFIQNKNATTFFFHIIF
jgi:hypothetical protein